MAVINQFVKAGAVLLSAALLASCSRDPEQSRRRYLASGDAYVAKKQYPEAAIEYRNAVQAAPRSGEAHLKLAETYAKVNDTKGAYREYIRAADLLPNDAATQLRAGQVLLLAGKFEDAKTRARNVLNADSKNIEAHILLGNAMAGLKDLDGAIKEIEVAIDSDPRRSLTYSNLGQLKLAAGDGVQAERAFRTAVSLDPKAMSARVALANYLWSTGNLTETEKTLKAGLPIDPNNILLNQALATFYVQSKRPAEAERYLKAAASASSAAGPQIVLADYYIGQQRREDALTVLRSIDDQSDGSAQAQTRIAAIEYEAGRTAEGHKIVDGVLARDPHNAEALVVKSRFLLHENAVDEALKRAKEAATANPRLSAAHYLLGKLQELKNEPEEAARSFGEVLKIDPRAVAAELEMAKISLGQGNTEAAVQFAQEATRHAPSSPDAHLMLAQAVAARGDLVKAESELKLAAAEAPDSAIPVAALGRLYVNQNRHEDAKRLLKKAFDLDPSSVAALTGLIDIDVREGRSGDARARVDNRLARSPNDPAILVLAGQTYAAIGDQAKAEQYLKQSVQVDPNSLKAYGMLARLYVSQGRLDDARSEFDTIFQRQPRAVGAGTMSGMILEKQEKLAEAQKRYEQVLAIDPNAAVAANNLAWIFAQGNGNLDVALRLAQTAKAKLPEQPEINDTLGWIYYKKGLSTLAISTLKESVASQPANPNFLYHLGLAYAQNGDKAEARQSLEQALKLGASFPGADNARQVLTSIQR